MEDREITDVGTSFMGVLNDAVRFRNRKHKTAILSTILSVVSILPALAAVDVDMKLNNDGYDPFLAEVVFDNNGQTLENAQIFGQLGDILIRRCLL